MINTASKAQLTNLYYARSFVQLLPSQCCTAPPTLYMCTSLCSIHIPPCCRLIQDSILPYSLSCESSVFVFEPLPFCLDNTCYLHLQNQQERFVFLPLFFSSQCLSGCLGQSRYTRVSSEKSQSLSSSLFVFWGEQWSLIWSQLGGQILTHLDKETM